MGKEVKEMKLNVNEFIFILYYCMNGVWVEGVGNIIVDVNELDVF